MSNPSEWDDKSREYLRKRLRSIILGELRLAKQSPEDILQMCRDVYIQGDCPENERDKFIRFATEVLDRAAAKLTTEQATWPKLTDCDRLDRVEAALRDNGILLWQASPCCDTCTGGELPQRIDFIENRHPGFRKLLRGYSFFIDQNLPDELAESTTVSLYLAYGWWLPDDSQPEPRLYEKNALAIAREVCECLRNQQFEVDWNGSFDRKIGISLNWQRRTMLE